jgi:cell division protein ZipA
MLNNSRMDADILRLLLIIAGGLFLVGLYVWERRRARSEEEEPYEDEELDEDKPEPRLGAWPGEDAEEGRNQAVRGSVPKRPSPGGAAQRSDLHRAVSEAPPAASVKGSLVLLLHITPIAGTFDGEAIVRAAGRCGVEPGEMDIFHRYLDPESTTNPLFSVANMVKPGTFPFGAMADFQSPGLTLFCQMEGAADDPARLEAMLEAAYCLADELDAEIRDETRSPLTPQVAERLRDRVLDLVARRLSDTSTE